MLSLSRNAEGDDERRREEEGECDPSILTQGWLFDVVKVFEIDELMGSSAEGIISGAVGVEEGVNDRSEGESELEEIGEEIHDW